MAGTPLDKYPTTPQADAYPALHDLAFQKMVMTSAKGTGDLSALTDGDASTKWSSPAIPDQWMVIDLGAQRKFSVILLDWDGAGAASYTLESSNNGDNWNPLCEVGSGDGGKDYLPVPATESRYIRISTKSAAGLSLFAVEVLGSEPAQRPQRRRN